MALKGSAAAARTAARTAASAALQSLQGSHFLGLDVSLSSTGLCILDSRGALARTADLLAEIFSMTSASSQII